MRLSILDQSPVRHGGTTRQAFAETLELARLADGAGFHRYWVSEHHGSSFLATSAPEVMLSAIGAATSRIRIGSGGVMLPHYSAFKVAEVFSMLSNLYPHRVDLGVGRAPGTDMETARALAPDGVPRFDRFPRQVLELRQRLADPSMKPRLVPVPVSPPPIWVLGTSPDSALLAARNGLPYNFACFINSDMGPEIMELYRREFVPSDSLAEPEAMITVDVFVGVNDEEAHQRSLSWRLAWSQIVNGSPRVELFSVEDAARHHFTSQESHFLDRKVARSAIGTPGDVRRKLESLAADYGADEIMTVTITHDFADRLASYCLLAREFGLNCAAGSDGPP